MAVQTIGIAGLGAIGSHIARELDRGVDGLTLTAVAERNVDAARERLWTFRHPPKLVALAQLVEADIVVECMPAAAFDQIAGAVLDAGKTFVPCSVGALLARPALIEKARQTGSRIVVPTGALGGLDAVRAIAQEPIFSVKLESRKPPKSLQGVPYIESGGVDLDALTAPLRVFAGDAMQAATHFPANANVAAALALAGVGPELTRVEIWADPTVTRNIHKVEVDGQAARLTVIVENVQSDTNPKTSRLAALSILACLKSLGGALRVGS